MVDRSDGNKETGGYAQSGSTTGSPAPGGGRPGLRFFLAGIMQGSHRTDRLHGQEYREHLRRAFVAHFPEAKVYDPLTNHAGSLHYDEETGRRVFFGHNLMCREIDVLVAFVPEASMGTAIEMWEACQHGAAVITISPMRRNWTVRFLSHAVYEDLRTLEEALASGEVERIVESVLAARPRAADAE